MTKRWLPVPLRFVPFAMVLASTVPLEPYAGTNFIVSMPKSWTVSEDAGNGLLIARQNPARDDSPAVLFLVKTAEAGVTEDQLLDTIANQFAKNLKIGRREAIPGVCHVMIEDGIEGIIRVRVVP